MNTTVLQHKPRQALDKDTGGRAGADLVPTGGPPVRHLSPRHPRLSDRALFKHSPETTTSATGPTAETSAAQRRAARPPTRPSVLQICLSVTNHDHRRDNNDGLIWRVIVRTSVNLEAVTVILLHCLRSEF
ncbi:hypothetical protein VZT92_006734 [Zoarces viviparus]|uniref:Uncharacterized protein n=1 Tax=Zoarces viviparus TaxID=48416 RepID=A0AAW1FQC9_ZOAVI